MEEFSTTYQKWRKRLFHVNVIIASFIFIVEVAMYFVIKDNKQTVPSLPIYLFRYLAIPTIADFSVIIVGYYLLKHKSNSWFVNYIPPVQLAFICMVVTTIHYVFSITLGVFCIPLFTTVIFSNKKITKRVSILCYVFLIVALINRRFSTLVSGSDPLFIEDTILAFVILFLSNKICEIIIEFQVTKSKLIDRYYLNELRMQNQLNKDSKTGLFGHAFLMNTLDKMIASAHKPIALAFLDIDDFKKVNDTHGHLNGDHVIVTLSNIMKKYTGRGHLMARFGGEEFAILFDGSAAESAIDFMESFRQEFANQKYDFTDDPITISIGLAFWENGLSSEDLFNCADAAMYQAKANGKNQVFSEK